MRARGRGGMVLLITLALVAGCIGLPRPLPSRIAVLGDSISRAVNSVAPGERLESSWATGDDITDRVESFAERIHARSPGLTLHTSNDAESGAKMSDLAAQAQRAVEQRAELVLILMGANDVCRRQGPTSIDEYRAGFDEGARTLRAGLPTATIYVISLPDLYALWAAEHNDTRAQFLWRASRACPALLAENVTNAQRLEVRGRVAAYNGVLQEESERFGFWTDRGAIARASFQGDDLSRFDAFHPSARGQAKLAEAAWAAGPYVDN